MSAAAGFSALAIVAFASPAAQAGEFCSVDSSNMRGCGYQTMAQCQAAQAGKNGSCMRDPFYKDPNSALASYQPKHKRAAKTQVEQ